MVCSETNSSDVFTSSIETFGWRGDDRLIKIEQKNFITINVAFGVLMIIFLYPGFHNSNFALIILLGIATFMK